MANMDDSTVSLGDCLTVLTDYHANGSYERLKENITLLDMPDYAAMIRTTNFENEDFDNLKYISEHAYHFLAKSKVYPSDILMNKIASPGSVYRMPNLRRPVSLAMNLFLLRTDETRLNQTYAYYWLKANEPYVKGFACGAATATITKKAVRELKISLPSISTQRRIADILVAYDELIENNQQRIRILEAMTRALYREWLVHLLSLGMNVNSVAPSKSLDCAKGTLGDLCDLTKVSYDDAQHSELPLLDLAHIPSNTLAPKDAGNPSELTTSRIVFKNGDTLFGAIRCYLHKVVIAPYPGVTNVSVLVLHPKRPEYRALLAVLASSPDTIRWADQHSTGTKMPVINGNVFKTLPAPVPSPTLAASFERAAGPMLDELCLLSIKNQNLRRTRDLMLPRLLSGQVALSADTPPITA